MRNHLTEPIPNISIPNTAGIQIQAVDDPLVCISDSMQGTLLFQPRYLQRGLPGATSKMYVRKTVAEMLLRAARNLPAGYKLKIWDAWRPPTVQKSLFDEYYAKLHAIFQGTGRTDEELKKMVQCFVSYPSEDPNNPFVHATGGAVDLSVVDANGNELDMGTDFDDFSEAAHTAYFESAPSSRIRDNRRILYNAMVDAGFTNYPAEWWHYDYGDNFWAALKGKEALYRGVYTEPCSLQK